MPSFNKPLILISNDDGVLAKGLESLIRALMPLADLFVVAPDGGRSGQSCAITSTIPIRAKLLKESNELTIYECSGSPVDCAKLALGNLMPRKPDLIVSGINHGSNSSISVHYSGTMGIAIEGTFNDIPSIGFSLCCLHNPDADFTQAEYYARLITEKVLIDGLPEGIFLNVNVPYSEIKGIKICRQAKAVWTEEFEERTDPYNGKYYWLTGYLKNREPDSEDTDEYALSHGYVSVVPCTIDLTAGNLIKEKDFPAILCSN